MYLTRNQAYRKVSGVRIPASPPLRQAKALIHRAFLYLTYLRPPICPTTVRSLWSLSEKAKQ